MDVLEANFPHAVSLTVAAANYEDVLSLPTSHNPRACANPAIIWNPGVTKDEETKGRPPQACGQMFLDEVIINLRWAGTLVVMSNDPEILDFARAYLENECQKLRRLYQDPILFETDDARAAFFRRVAKQLNSIMEINSSWTDLESSLKESEAAACGVTMREMDLAQAADSNDAWVQPCSNSVHFPSRPIMQQALDKGTTLLTCEQYLPRGGPWIMLRWQKKVDSIVESILQTTDDTARRAIIRQQKPRMPDTYAYRTDQVWRPGEVIRLMTRPHTQEMRRVYLKTRDESIVKLAGMMARRMGQRSFGSFDDRRKYAGLTRRKFHLVQGMWAEKPLSWSAEKL